MFVVDDPNRKLLCPQKSSQWLCLKAMWVAAKVVFSVPQSALTMLGHPVRQWSIINCNAFCVYILRRKHTKKNAHIPLFCSTASKYDTSTTLGSLFVVSTSNQIIFRENLYVISISTITTKITYPSMHPWMAKPYGFNLS